MCHGCHVSHCCIVTRTRVDQYHPQRYGRTFGDQLKSLDQWTSAGARRSQQCVNAESGRPGRLPAGAPHRSGRAGLPHPALRDEASLLTADRMIGNGWRKANDFLTFWGKLFSEIASPPTTALAISNGAITPPTRPPTKPQTSATSTVSAMIGATYPIAALANEIRDATLHNATMRYVAPMENLGTHHPSFNFLSF